MGAPQPAPTAGAGAAGGGAAARTAGAAEVPGVTSYDGTGRDLSDCAGVGCTRAQRKGGVDSTKSAHTKSAVWHTEVGGKKTTPPSPAQTERAPSTSRDRGRANRAHVRDQHAHTACVCQARGHPAQPCRAKMASRSAAGGHRTPPWGAPAPRPPTRDKRTHRTPQARCTTRQPVTSPRDGGLPRPAGVGPRQGHKHRPPTAHCLTQPAKGTPTPPHPHSQQPRRAGARTSRSAIEDATGTAGAGAGAGTGMGAP
jgi:hypothetical protein